MEKKEKHKFNKRLFLIILFIVLILGLIVFIGISNSKIDKYDLTKISQKIENHYKDENLEIVHEEDVISYFPIPTEYMSTSVLAANFNPNVEQDDYKNAHLIFFVTELKKNDRDDVYEFLEGFAKSYSMKYVEDADLEEIMANAIVKKGKDYVYLILGSRNKEMEEDLLSLMK